jgi:hypothetical protein
MDPDATKYPREYEGNTLTYYYYIDQGLLQDKTYYYVVRSFDKGKLANDGSIEVPVLITPLAGSYKSTNIDWYPQDAPFVDVIKGDQGEEDPYVFPNPYRGSHEWEKDGAPDPNNPGQFYWPREIFFANLPETAEIKVFTLAGDHLFTINHNQALSGNTYEVWDMLNKNGQEIVAGIYLYTVQSSDADDFTDKFVVIK